MDRKRVILGKTTAPYSSAVIYDENLIFISGQIPNNSQAAFSEQAKSALDNLAQVLALAGSSIKKVLKTTVYLTDINEFAVLNEVYGEYFSKEPPARAAVGVLSLPLGVKIEIEAIAYK